MTIREPEQVELSTPTGPMRTYVFRSTGSGRCPGILLFSEILQVTAPIRRTAALLAGRGFVVAVPEIYGRDRRRASRNETLSGSGAGRLSHFSAYSGGIALMGRQAMSR